MKSEELAKLGCPKGPIRKKLLKSVGRAIRDGLAADVMKERVAALLESPANFVDDDFLGAVASELEGLFAAQARYHGREEPAPYAQWGENLEGRALEQMRNACTLPVAAAGALMPDAHPGYGLPIGGVLRALASRLSASESRT